MALPHLEARVRIYQGEIPGLEEEPRMAADGFRSCEPLLAPQTAGPLGGVVSPGSGQSLPGTINEAAHTAFSWQTSRQNGTVSAAALGHCKIRNLRRGSLERVDNLGA